MTGGAGLIGGRGGIVCVGAGEGWWVVGVNPVRSGWVGLSERDPHGFAYYWWLRESAPQTLPRTVDIHRKPGYDAVELFFDPGTKGIPLNPALVRGSHGTPAVEARHRGAIVCSSATPFVEAATVYRVVDVKRIILGLLGIGDG